MPAIGKRIVWVMKVNLLIRDHRSYKSILYLQEWVFSLVVQLVVGISVRTHFLYRLMWYKASLILVFAGGFWQGFVSVFIIGTLYTMLSFAFAEITSIVAFAGKKNLIFIFNCTFLLSVE